MVDAMRDRVLTVREAAAIIYRTKEPTPVQLRGVEKRLERRALGGRKAADRSWTTTAACVAEYMADQVYHRQLGDGQGNREDRPAVGRAGQAQPPPRKEYDSLRTVYKELLGDYFLALIFRPRGRRTAKTFRWAVLAGQAGLLLLIVALLATRLSSMFHTVLAAPPAEQVIVTQWLSAHERQFAVTHWHPATPARGQKGLSVRVEYTYTTPEGNLVDTDRVFIVQEGSVRSVSSSP